MKHTPSFRNLLFRLTAFFLLLSSPLIRAAVVLEEGITPSADWPVQVTIATGDPGDNTVGVTVNSSTVVSQTFTPTSNMTLGAMYVSYSTTSASAANSYTLRIQQVTGGSGATTYTSGTNLLGATPVTFSLANTGGAIEILKFEFSGTHQIALSAGSTYAFEIVSSASSVNLYRRGSDTYTGGAFYTNRTAFSPSRDLALAVVSASAGSGDNQAPSVPSALVAAAVSSAQINLSWNASTDNIGVVGYKIFRNGTQIDTTTSNSYSNMGLTAATAYSYTVAAYDAIGNTSAQSASASATTPGGSGGSVSISEGITPVNVWPETVTLQTADPSLSTTGVTVNSGTVVSQTFTPSSNMALGSLFFTYSTSAASSANAFTIRIQQVSGGAAAQTYALGTDLLSAIPVTFSLASTGGATRVMEFQFAGAYQIPLASGNTYAVEIASTGSALNLFRRGADSYAGGNAYSNRSAINYPSTRDLAMGVLAAGATAPDADSDGMPDSWETAYGLNPASAADANLDPDGDGLTNLQEYLAGTNPNVHNGPGGGTVTASVETANGYELEGTAARVKINRTGGTAALTVNFTRTGVAGASDYSTKDGNGTTITTSISIPAGATSATVVLQPTADTLNEYPENAVITVTSGSGYTVGATPAATVTLNDAADIASNEQLFIAPLTPAPGVAGSGSGVATMYLNGPKNRARVSLNFSGLSSSQTNSYIRYGSTGTELRPNMGTGQLTDVIWNIAPATPYSGQQIIDALYQSGGASVYTNLGTVNYPAGEIQGTWAREASGGAYPPPAPPAITALTGTELNRDVARFLTQSTFGPTQAEIDAMVASITTTYGGDRIAAYDAWIDTQLAYDQTKLEDYVRAVNRRDWSLRGLDVTAPNSASYPANNGIRHGWWLNSLKSRDQLRQRFAFATSEIFVVSGMDFIIFLQKYGASNYYDMLGSYATGNFRDLLESVSKHPIMGQYLSSLKNQKAVFDAQGNALVSPDENYAREIMQLFSIGLVQRRMDGAVQVNGTGIPLQTYDNDDIQNLARVFTGWSFGKTIGTPETGYPAVDNTNFFLSVNSKAQGFYSYAWTHPMKNFSAYHDTAQKTVLGTNIAAGLDGEADLDAAHDILFNHPSTAPFISRLLIQRFVTSNPSPGYIYRVAKKFENNGSGVRGDMKAVIKAILLDYEARTLSVASGNTFGKQKEPMIRFAQAIRSFDGHSQLPLGNLSSYGYPAGQLDNFPAGTTHYCFNDSKKELVQSPQLSPSVFNWFLPDYSPSGPVAEAGLVAPEMQITTETSVIAAINHHRGLFLSTNFNAEESLYGITDATLDDIIMNLSPVAAIYDNARTAGQTVPQATAAALDYVDGFLMAGGMKAAYAGAPAPNPRSIIIDGVGGMTTSTTIERMRELLYLVITSPQYIHQK